MVKFAIRSGKSTTLDVRMDGRMDVRINVGMDVSMNTVGQNLVSDRINSDLKSTKIGSLSSNLKN